MTGRCACLPSVILCRQSTNPPPPSFSSSFHHLLLLSPSNSPLAGHPLSHARWYASAMPCLSALSDPGVREDNALSGNNTLGTRGRCGSEHYTCTLHLALSHARWLEQGARDSLPDAVYVKECLWLDPHKEICARTFVCGGHNIMAGGRDGRRESVGGRAHDTW